VLERTAARGLTRNAHRRESAEQLVHRAPVDAVSPYFVGLAKVTRGKVKKKKKKKFGSIEKSGRRLNTEMNVAPLGAMRECGRCRPAPHTKSTRRHRYLPNLPAILDHKGSVRAARCAPCKWPRPRRAPFRTGWSSALRRPVKDFSSRCVELGRCQGHRRRRDGSRAKFGRVNGQIVHGFLLRKIHCGIVRIIR